MKLMGEGWGECDVVDKVFRKGLGEKLCKLEESHWMLKKEKLRKKQANQ